MERLFEIVEVYCENSVGKEEDVFVLEWCVWFVVKCLEYVLVKGIIEFIV